MQPLRPPSLCAVIIIGSCIRRCYSGSSSSSSRSSSSSTRSYPLDTPSPFSARVVYLLVRGAVMLRRAIAPRPPPLSAQRLPPPVLADALAEALPGPRALPQQRISRKMNTLADSQHLLTVRHDDPSPWFGEAALFADDARGHAAVCANDCQVHTIYMHVYVYMYIYMKRSRSSSG